MAVISALLLLPSLLNPQAKGSKPIGVTRLEALTNQILVVEYEEGYEVREKLGKPDFDGKVVLEPLNLAAAAEKENYTITSTAHSAYVNPTNPIQVGRKMKGEHFVNENWKKFSFVPHHWLYLKLPSPMMEGIEYKVDLSRVIPTAGVKTIRFSAKKTRSDAIHVNQVGYITQGRKIGYVSAWMGDMGRLELAPYVGKGFQILNTKTGKAEFSGEISLRKQWEQPDSIRTDEPESMNHAKADVYECDFSRLVTPGRYVLSIPGVGCSYPFEVGTDAYTNPFITTVRGLYHQRSGIALTEPYTKFTRPVEQLPSIKPMLQTKTRYMDMAYHDGWEQTKIKPETTGEKRDVWGGYHDAGDWDREDWHPLVPAWLLTVYELNPKAFRAGELNIPESKSGIPDILSEAAWGVDYYMRLQRKDGAVSVGLFEDSFPRPEETSWTDSMKWYIYAEDPSISFKFAAVATKLAYSLRNVGQPKRAAEYVAAAERAYQWAHANQKPGDELKIRDDRFYASAELYRFTGKPIYHEQFKKDCVIKSKSSVLRLWGEFDQASGAYTYLLTPTKMTDPGLRDRLYGAMLTHAKEEGLDAIKLRSFRFAGITNSLIMYGGGALPQVRPLMMAHHFTKDKIYLDAIIDSCGLTLGANPMNMTWVTGLGAQSPTDVLHTDSWYVRDGNPPPGLTIFGPHRFVKDKAAGPWDPGWAQQNAAYPSAEQWPTLELWFQQRSCAATGEYTVANIAETAMAFGYLRPAVAVSSKPVSPSKEKVKRKG